MSPTVRLVTGGLKITNKLMLSEKALSKFKEIYQKEFGAQLTDEQASRKGLELLSFFKLIYRPIPKEDEEFFKLKIIKTAI